MPIKSKPTYLRYEEAPDELSSKYLKFGEWYLRHEILFYKLSVGALIAFCVATVGYSSFVWGNYLLFGYVADTQAFARALKTNPNYVQMRNIFGWQDLAVMDVNVYQGSSKKYDFVAMVRNPNLRWIAHAKFKYSYAGGETKIVEGIVLPGTEQPIGFFGAEIDQLPQNVQLNLVEVKWNMVSAHSISDVPSYVADRTNFSVDKFNFVDGGSGGKLPTISFNLLNGTAYSYWRPVFYAALLSNDQVAGYQYLFFDSIKSGETKSVSASILQTTAKITGVRLYSAIDIFDNSVYIAPQK